MKKIILGFLFLMGAPAFAEWKEDSIVLDVINTTNQNEIAQTLGFVNDFRNHLVSLNLASPSKLVVKSISAHVVYVKWVNDQTCQVANPNQVEKQRSETVSATFYYADNPSHIKNTGMGSMFASPCHK